MVAVEGRQTMMDRPRPRVHLAFALPKGKRLDWLLEKATELGAASLRPVVFERSVAGRDGEFSPNKQARWLVHCVAAAKQCRRVFLPTIDAPLPLSQAVETIRQEQPETLFLYGGFGEHARSILDFIPPKKSIAFFVGPEGGMTETEEQLLQDWEAIEVCLSRHVLRVETAGVALAAILGAGRIS